MKQIKFNNGIATRADFNPNHDEKGLFSSEGGAIKALATASHSNPRAQGYDPKDPRATSGRLRVVTLLGIDEYERDIDTFEKEHGSSELLRRSRDNLNELKILHQQKKYKELYSRLGMTHEML
jgi:hypothetical protein